MKICDRAPASGGTHKGGERPLGTGPLGTENSPHASPVTGPLRFLAVVAAVGLLLVAAAPVRATTLCASPVPMPKGQDTVLYAPGVSTPAYNVFTYTGSRETALNTEGYTFAASLTEPFCNTQGDFHGTAWSEAWRSGDPDGHMLFLYRLGVDNESEKVLQQGNVYDFNPGWDITDAGVIHAGTDTSFMHGDPLVLSRFAAPGPYQEEQVEFYFWQGETRELIVAGEQSSWFYVETDAPDCTIGYFTVQDGGATESVRALVPIPEPLTVVGVFMGVCGLAGYLRRRKMLV